MKPHQRRRRPRGRSSAFALIEALVGIAVGVALIAILGRITLGLLSLEQRAREHATRVAAMDNLADHLQRDLWDAAEARFEDGELHILLPDRAAPAVVYAFAEQRVRRVQSGVETAAWSAKKLLFDWEVDRDGRDAVLIVHAVAVPPQRAEVLPPRVVPLVFVLPTPQPEDRP